MWIWRNEPLSLWIVLWWLSAMSQNDFSPPIKKCVCIYIYLYLEKWADSKHSISCWCRVQNGEVFYSETMVQTKILIPLLREFTFEKGAFPERCCEWMDRGQWMQDRCRRRAAFGLETVGPLESICCRRLVLVLVWLLELLGDEVYFQGYRWLFLYIQSDLRKWFHLLVGGVYDTDLLFPWMAENWKV